MSSGPFLVARTSPHSTPNRANKIAEAIHRAEDAEIAGSAAKQW